MLDSKKELLIKAIEKIEDEGRIRVIYYYVLNLKPTINNMKQKKE